MTMAISVPEVHQAKRDLQRMKRSLVKWMKFREITDKVARGELKTRVASGSAIAAQQIVDRPTTELPLAQRLHALLSTIEPDASLPDPAAPDAAISLATFAITGKPTSIAAGTTASGMSGFGGAAHPWMWPAIIVGGLLLAVTTAITSAADVAKDREEKACIMAGACTDYGFWLKAAALSGGAYLVLVELGVWKKIKDKIAKL